MNITYTKAQTSDFDRLNALFTEMLQTIYNKEEVEGYGPTDLDYYFEGGESWICLAQTEETATAQERESVQTANPSQTVGFLSIEVHRDDSPFLYLDDFAVTQDYRNQGIGSELISRAEAYAKQLGISKIRLHVEQENQRAFRFYERIGFGMEEAQGSRMLMCKEFKQEDTKMSRVDFGAKPLMTPMPVLIIGTYDEAGVPNAMNAAWGITTDYKEITISLAEHKTTENLAKTGAFTVSMGTVDTMKACDYVGVVSATKVPDKFAKAGFHATKSSRVNAPLIDELPVALECTVKSFADDILVGEIVNVTADESVITDGKIDIRKLRPIAYNAFDNTYVELGAAVGNAFADGLELK